MDCPLTGHKVEFENYRDTICYQLTIAENNVTIFICRNCIDEISLDSKHHIVTGLIANKKWPERSLITSKGCSLKDTPKESEKLILPEYLETADYPKNPSQRMNHLFLNLFNLQKTDGEIIKINLREEQFWVRNYFRSMEECKFYMDGLVENGLIHFDFAGYANTPSKITITHSGLNKAVELSEEGNNSNSCFIAMAFSEEMSPYREAIKKALKTTGYDVVIIDEVHLESDKTIPDGILSGIKKSKFCIADFTNHRNGVYFESGYALGLGKPVIYLCEEKEFEKAHFDIKQLQHIIYKTPEELEKRLVEKIEAWIKE